MWEKWASLNLNIASNIILNCRQLQCLWNYVLSHTDVLYMWVIRIIHCFWLFILSLDYNEFLVTSDTAYPCISRGVPGHQGYSSPPDYGHVVNI